MAVISEGKVQSDWLEYEVDGGHHAYCRDEVIILAGSGTPRDLKTGTVMAVLTGKWQAVVDGASDGTQTAAGILIADVIAAVGVDNPNGVVLRRGPAVVKKQGLSWPVGHSQAEIDANCVVLENLGIQVRTAL